MNIYILRNGNQTGPFADEYIKDCIRSGSFTSSDLAWKEGLTEWVALGSLFPEMFPPQPQIPATPPKPTASGGAPATEGTSETGPTQSASTETFAKSILKKAAVTARLTQKQAHRKKLETFDLKQADYQTGKKAYEQNIAPDQHAELRAQIAGVLSEIATLKNAPEVVATTIADKAKAAGNATARTAKVELLAHKQKGLLSELGTRLRENSADAPALSTEITAARGIAEAIRELDSEIRALSSQTFSWARHPLLVLTIVLGLLVAFIGYGWVKGAYARWDAQGQTARMQQQLEKEKLRFDTERLEQQRKEAEMRQKEQQAREKREIEREKEQSARQAKIEEDRKEEERTAAREEEQRKKDQQEAEHPAQRAKKPVPPEWNVVLEPEKWVDSLFQQGEQSMWQSLGSPKEIDEIVLFSPTAKDSGVTVKRNPNEEGIFRAVKTKDLPMLLERMPNSPFSSREVILNDAKKAAKDLQTIMSGYVVWSADSDIEQGTKAMKAVEEKVSIYFNRIVESVRTHDQEFIVDFSAFDYKKYQIRLVTVSDRKKTFKQLESGEVPSKLSAGWTFPDSSGDRNISSDPNDRLCLGFDSANKVRLPWGATFFVLAQKLNDWIEDGGSRTAKPWTESHGAEGQHFYCQATASNQLMTEQQKADFNTAIQKIKTTPGNNMADFDTAWIAAKALWNNALFLYIQSLLSEPQKQLDLLYENYQKGDMPRSEYVEKAQQLIKQADDKCKQALLQ